MCHWSTQFYVENVSNVCILFADGMPYYLVAHHSWHSFNINSMKWTNSSFDAFPAILFFFQFIRIWRATNTHNVHSTKYNTYDDENKTTAQNAERDWEKRKKTISAKGFLGYSFFFPTDITFDVMLFFFQCMPETQPFPLCNIIVFVFEWILFSFYLVFIVHSLMYMLQLFSYRSTN